MFVDRWFFSLFNYFRIAKEEARPWGIRCVSRAAPGGRHRRPGRRGGAAGLGDGQAPPDSISPHWWRLEPNRPKRNVSRTTCSAQAQQLQACRRGQTWVKNNSDAKMNSEGKKKRGKVKVSNISFIKIVTNRKSQGFVAGVRRSPWAGSATGGRQRSLRRFWGAEITLRCPRKMIW